VSESAWDGCSSAAQAGQVHSDQARNRHSAILVPTLEQTAYRAGWQGAGGRGQGAIWRASSIIEDSQALALALARSTHTQIKNYRMSRLACLARCSSK